MEQKQSGWKRIIFTTIITALITATITLGVGWLITHFQESEPHLTYTIDNAVPFQGPSESIAIYNVTIGNDGKEMAENIICQLSFLPAKILQSKLTIDPAIVYSETSSNNSYRLEIPDLNAGEKAIVSILASSIDSLPTRPSITLRGKDVNGVEASTKTGMVNNSWMFAVLSAVALYSIIFAIYITLQQRRGETKDESKHSDDQRQILAYLCSIHQLDVEVGRYNSMNSETSYWAESDRFAMLAIKMPVGQEVENRKCVLVDLLKYAVIHPTSEGIIHYNIARIAKVQNNKEEMDKHLEEAKKLIPKLINTRFELDPIWKEK